MLLGVSEFALYSVYRSLKLCGLNWLYMDSVITVTKFVVTYSRLFTIRIISFFNMRLCSACSGIQLGLQRKTCIRYPGPSACTSSFRNIL